MGIGGAFYLFAGVLVAAVPVVYFVLPETKDLGLEMIQEYFKPQRTVFYVQGSQEGGSSLQGEAFLHLFGVGNQNSKMSHIFVDT